MSKFEICQKLSKEVYKDWVQTNIDGWTKLKHKEEDSVKQKGGKVNIFKKKNFACTAYQKDCEIIIAFRGTDDKKDIIEDVKIAINKGLKTDDYAHKFVDEIIKEYPNKKIILTGHSLGGAYAQLACVKKLIAGFDCCAYTYNAPGMALFSRKNKYKGNYDKTKITNYVVMNDFIGNYRAHIGHTYYFQPFPMDKTNNKGELQAPHGCILHYTKEDLGGLISKSNLTDFGSKNGLALWCCDKKNCTDKKVIKLLKNPLRKYHLENALEILRGCKEIKMTNPFEYIYGRNIYKLV